MSFDAVFLFSFAMVFIRCSAMLLSSPIFAGQSSPVQIRIFTTLAISGALTMVVQPKIGAPPADLYGLAAVATQEAIAGLLIGSFINLAMQAAQIAGAIMDFQLGLSLSQVLNPVSGVSVTILAQFKYMLAVVILFAMNGHHLMIEAFASSYTAVPTLSMATLNAISTNITVLIGNVMLLGLQIAMPVLGASLIIDAALGLMNKAVPQMQVFIVGMPAKTAVGLMVVGITLPALAGAVSSGVQFALDGLTGIFRM